MDAIFNLAPHFLDLFGRAGGGGSSSGGDSGMALFVLIGYAPMHILGRFLRQRTSTGGHWKEGQIFGWFSCAAFVALLLGLGIKAMPADISYGTSDATWLLVGEVVVGAIIGTGAGLYSWFDALKRSRETSQSLQRSASLDPAWDEKIILGKTKQLFLRYQTDWSKRDYLAMKSYTTRRYYNHAALLVAVMTQAGRINDVRNPVIKEMMITDSHDSTKNDEDRLTVGLTAIAQDVLIDAPTGDTLFTDDGEFTEFWRLQRSENDWLLDGIEQATSSTLVEINGLRSFAEDHGYFYSLDMGWLFIPNRGLLFSDASFGKSDINNHVVGIYKQSYLMQLYTYVPVQRGGKEYIVAQTNVPKNYGRIIVRRKHLFGRGIKGLRRISMESGDFNKKYDVFASTEEAATSFELLHPAYIEALTALPFEITIEVIDTAVYLYATKNNGMTGSNQPYEIMLNVLMEAYRQMRM